jgi:aspartate ammonia-lyase
MTQQDQHDLTLYGEQTRLALANFPLTGRRLSDVPSLVRSYAWVKAAAARANAELGALDREPAAFIEGAAQAVAAGQHDGAFPLPLIQGGGGTSTNMNVNEVIARLATNEAARHGAPPVHPIDHVNRSQSTNDTYPTAMALTVRQLAAATDEALDRLSVALLAKAKEYPGVDRLGRTCLQDAVLLTIADTHTAQADAVRRVRAALDAAVGELSAVPLGATAVGTGIGAPAGYPELAVRHLRAISGLPVSVAPNFFDALANLDPYSAVANGCVRAATVVSKIAADIRLLSSGPAGGFGEISVPPLQAGSSIMPGKVNPVVPEYVMQLGFRIRGAAATVDAAVAAGELELNVMEPVIVDALITALTDLGTAADVLADRCVSGLTWNPDAVARNARAALDRRVELASHAGYQQAAASAS